MTFLYLEISPILEVTATAFLPTIEVRSWDFLLNHPQISRSRKTRRKVCGRFPSRGSCWGWCCPASWWSLPMPTRKANGVRNLGFTSERLVSSVNLGCLVVGTAGLLLKGPETPKLKRKWRMDGYFKKGEHFFQVLYINHHYDIMTMYWIQWAEKTFKHSCLMNGWRWLALVDFEVWPFPDRHSRGQGRDNFNPQGLKPEFPHDTYTQNGEDWEFLRKKRITFIHFLYSACWCGDYGCSLKSTLSMWTSWYIFMCIII